MERSVEEDRFASVVGDDAPDGVAAEDDPAEVTHAVRHPISLFYLFCRQLKRFTRFGLAFACQVKLRFLDGLGSVGYAPRELLQIVRHKPYKPAVGEKVLVPTKPRTPGEQYSAEWHVATVELLLDKPKYSYKPVVSEADGDETHDGSAAPDHAHAHAPRPFGAPTAQFPIQRRTAPSIRLTRVSPGILTARFEVSARPFGVSVPPPCLPVPVWCAESALRMA
jgi:hypothetical protein